MNEFTVSMISFVVTHKKMMLHSRAKIKILKGGVGVSESVEAEDRLFREAARLRHQALCQQRATAPRRYGLAILWVALAFAYCRQWDDITNLPPGAATTFLVAVSLSVRGGGGGPGWMAFALSLLCVWFGFYEPAEVFPTIRFGWFAVGLLTPLFVAGNLPCSKFRSKISRSKGPDFPAPSKPISYKIWSESPSR